MKEIKSFTATWRNMLQQISQRNKDTLNDVIYMQKSKKIALKEAEGRMAVTRI